jgi:hypothetical protein
MFIVTLEGFIPLPRFDGEPFLNARIEEASTADGPWGDLGLFPLSPLDADPSNPMARSFTVDNATLEHGWYRVVFIDADADTVTVGPVQNVLDPVESYRASVQDVADLLRARTLSQNGVEIGTFTDLTRPTDEQVLRLIDKAQGDVSARIGLSVPSMFIHDAQNLVAIRAAMYVELSYFPEQIRANKSVYPELLALWDQQLAALIASIEAAGEDGLLETGELGSALAPAYSFPVNEGGLVGWDTVM